MTPVAGGRAQIDTRLTGERAQPHRHILVKTEDSRRIQKIGVRVPGTPDRAPQLDEPPAARAYLVFGEGQAHALGRKLPTEVMQRAQIVLVDEPSHVLLQAASKRRLWIALRTLRRALAGATS